METSRWMCGAVVVLVLAGCGAPPAPVSSSAPAADKKKAELVEQSIVPPSFGEVDESGQEPVASVPKTAAVPSFGKVDNADPTAKVPTPTVAPKFGQVGGSKKAGKTSVAAAVPQFGAGGSSSVAGGRPATIVAQLQQIFGHAPPPSSVPDKPASGDTKSAATPATSQQVRELFLNLRADRDPATAIRRLEQFLARHSLNESQQGQVDKERDELKQQVTDGMVRNGSDGWLTPQQAEKKQQEASKQIAQAIKDIAAALKKGNRNNPGKLRVQLGPALKLLERASRTDLNNLQADFGLGSLNTAMFLNSPRVAAKHFRKARSRQPNHVPTLNNLALSEIQTGGFGEALKLWKVALTIEPGNTEVIHNLFRVVSEGTRSSLYVNERFLEIYKKECQRVKSADQYKATLAAAAKKGWIYLSLHDPKKKRAPVFFVDKGCNGCQRRGSLRGGKACKHCQGRGIDPRL